MNYSEIIDRHIYVKDGCTIPEEWIDLAIAAIDQAGFDIRTQESIRDELRNVRESKPRRLHVLKE